MNNLYKITYVDNSKYNKVEGEFSTLVAAANPVAASVIFDRNFKKKEIINIEQVKVKKENPNG